MSPFQATTLLCCLALPHTTTLLLPPLDFLPTLCCLLLQFDHSKCAVCIVPFQILLLPCCCLFTQFDGSKVCCVHCAIPELTVPVLLPVHSLTATKRAACTAPFRKAGFQVKAALAAPPTEYLLCYQVRCCFCCFPTEQASSHVC